jgi:hypothetical protein
MLLKQFPNEKRSRLIAGTGAEQVASVEYTLKELQGEFNFDVDIAAMIADSPTQRSTQAILNYNLMRADPLVDAKQLLLDVFLSQNKKAPDRYLIDLKDPAEEFQIMLGGFPVETHERDNHEAHMEAHDQDAQRLDQTIKGDGQGGEVENRQRLAVAQILLAAHMNMHVKALRALQEQSGPTEGQPMSTNMLRNQVRAGSGETAAELKGGITDVEDTIQ